ncbi:MAG: hypothetical protein ACI861_001949, partial [Paracoccaceae bacterium]
QSHSFDSWFQTADAFDKLLASGLINCAVCGNVEIKKAIMAPRVLPARSAASKPVKPSHAGALSQPASPAEQAFVELRRKIEEKSENVGDDFAAEARAIHDGDAPERAIIGKATPEAAKSLIDDGIPVAPLPWFSRKSN